MQQSLHLLFHHPYFIYREQRNRKIGFRKKYGMIDFGKNIIIIWILDKSRSVAPAKLEIKLVSPNRPLVTILNMVALYFPVSGICTRMRRLKSFSIFSLTSSHCNISVVVISSPTICMQFELIFLTPFGKIIDVYFES